MKKKDYIIQCWREFYNSRGLPIDEANEYLEYAESLIKKGLPPIFDFNHLTLLLGVLPSFLAKAVNNPESFYHTFTIPKRSGGERTITAPYPSLKYVQRWIQKNILNKCNVHGCVHGFVKHRSIISNVKVHCNQKYLLKIDIKDFFPSISINWIIQTFKKLGYNNEVSFYLASLCCYEGVLPQGSPASPLLSNIVSFFLDKRLYRLSKKFRINYSRYADDMAFSGEFISGNFIKTVQEILIEFNFEINTDKIRLYKENDNKILTGINISSGSPKIPRDYRRSLEQELYYIKKFGMRGHMSHNKIHRVDYIDSILGKVNFWLMVEPDNNYAQKMRSILLDYLA